MSTLSRVIFDPDSTPPSTPLSVAANALSQTTIRITWSASADTGGSGLAGYRVYRSTTSGGTYAQIGTDLSTASLSFDDTTLNAGAQRFYRVLAFDGNANTSALSAIVNATTSAASGAAEWGGRTPTHYVTAGASGSGNGSLANPWTIAQALTNAAAGNVVGVYEGTYTKSTGGSNAIPTFNVSSSGTAGNPIVFQARWPATGSYADALRSKLTNGVTSGSGPVTMGVTGRNYVVWDGFWCDEAISRSSTGIGPAVVTATTGSQLLRCRIDGVQIDYSNDNHSGIWIQDAVNCIVSNNYIRNIRPPSGGSVNSAGIFAWQSRGVTIYNNLIEDCNTGMYIKYDQNGSGFGGIDIRYNVINQMSIGIRIGDPSTTGQAGNSIVYNLIRNCAESGVNFSFGTAESIVPRLWDTRNNTFVDVVDCFYMGFQNTNALENVIIANNLHDAGTRFYYWDDANATIAAFRSRGMDSYYNSTRAVGTYARTATASYTTPASFHAATSLANGSQQFVAGATIFVNRSGGDFHLATGSPALTAGSTGGPIGCYVTGLETIGLLAA